MGRALGVSLAVHAFAIAVVLMARGDGARRTARRPVEHATYVEIQWPRAHRPIHPPIPIASARPAGGGYGVATTQPPPDTLGAPAPIVDVTATPSAPSGVAAPESLPLGGAVDDARGGSAARVRLGAELGDARLVVTPDGGAMPADDARYLAAFQAAMRAFNDSVQGDADRARRVRDWTWTDPRGRAWGVRDGVIFIAGTGTIYAEMQGERDQELSGRRLSRHRADIDFHADRAERARHVQERGRAVRERRDGERAGGRP